MLFFLRKNSLFSLAYLTLSGQVNITTIHQPFSCMTFGIWCLVLCIYFVDMVLLGTPYIHICMYETRKLVIIYIFFPFFFQLQIKISYTILKLANIFKNAHKWKSVKEKNIINKIVIYTPSRVHCFLHW